MKRDGIAPWTTLIQSENKISKNSQLEGKFPGNAIKYGFKEQLLVRNSVEGLCEIKEDHVDLTTDLRMLALS
ncbi:unnamed protein product [Porites evermanni]|uniref:Uncharacterized protein n=1 Tax=Porites evermanni TaxID=104178 RepID=A0ABN8MQ24_9CNID|nr:unnamed protein product [Porites evermanni]